MPSPCQACLQGRGSSAACVACASSYWARFLWDAARAAKIELIPRITPTDFIDSIDIEGSLARLLGDPNPVPSRITPQVRLRAGLAFREVLKETLATVDAELAKLQK